MSTSPAPAPQYVLSDTRRRQLRWFRIRRKVGNAFRKVDSLFRWHTITRGMVDQVGYRVTWHNLLRAYRVERFSGQRWHVVTEHQGDIYQAMRCGRTINSSGVLPKRLPSGGKKLGLRIEALGYRYGGYAILLGAGAVAAYQLGIFNFLALCIMGHASICHSELVERGLDGE